MSGSNNVTGSAPGFGVVTASTASRSIVALVVATLLASLFVVVPLQGVAAAGNTAVQLDLPVASSPGAVQLNGTSQYITLGTATQLRSPTFTVELWFQRTGAGASASTGSGGVLNAIPLITKERADGETAAQDVNYFLGIDQSSGKLVADFEEAQVAQGGTTPSLNHPITGNTAIAIGSTWHHAAATYDGSSWNLYLDGAADGTLVVNRVANSATNALTAVGSSLSTTGATSGFFAGVVDEVRIWSVARTAAQIAAAKNTEITGAQAGLMGRWGLNEASGSTATDTAGSSITGNLVATPTRVAGFNAPVQTNQYITLGTTAQLRSATFTVELWFQRTGTGVGTSTGSGGVLTAVPLITKGRAEAETAAADVNYFLGIDQSSGKLVADFEEAQVAQGGTTPSLNHPITGNTAIAVGTTWHHAAATYDGTTWNLYLDGVADGTLAVGRPAAALTTTVTSVGTALTTASAPDGYFAGVVDEVRIWNFARTAAQIAASKNIEITGAQAGLLGRWGLNEGSGTSAADSSGNGITGTLVGTPTPSWVAGFPIVTNAAPVAVADSYSTPKNTTLIVAGPGVLANDTDADGDSLTAAVVTSVSHGTLTLSSDGGFSYVPTAAYVGPDSFTYQANDGTANSNTATVNLTVTASNAAPACAGVPLTTAEDAPGDAAPSCTDADGDSLTYAIVGQPSHGTASIAAGQLHYVPAANYHGPDSFTYQANDGTIDSASATVTVTVSSVNDAPACAGVPLTTAEDAPGDAAPSCTDADGDSLTYAIVGQPSHGTALDRGRPAALRAGGQLPRSRQLHLPGQRRDGRLGQRDRDRHGQLGQRRPGGGGRQLQHAQEHDPDRGRPGRPRQRHRCRRRHPGRGGGHQRQPRHADPQPRRLLQLRPDGGLCRPRQLHLPGQ